MIVLNIRVPLASELKGQTLLEDPGHLSIYPVGGRRQATERFQHGYNGSGAWNGCPLGKIDAWQPLSCPGASCHVLRRIDVQHRGQTRAELHAA
jgi:hypothetical protein